MPLEIMSLAELAESWGTAPSKSVFVDPRAVARGLRSESRGELTAAAAQLAMLFGDTGAPELCVLVVEHASAIVGSAAGLESHRRLALMDLGLAEPTSPSIPLADVVGHTAVEEGPVAVFLREILAPLDGSLPHAIEFALRLVALRAGLVPRPDPLDVETVLALPDPAILLA